MEYTTDLPAVDLSALRTHFPALQEQDEAGRPYVYFDGPGGTQVPQTVIQAMADYLVRANANHGGRFVTSQRNDQIIDQARMAMADFLNARSPREIVFGANMTTLTFSLSRAIGRTLQPGDEIVVTRLDHDANIAPWLALEEQGIRVRWADFNVEDCRLNLDHLASLLSNKTRLIAVGYASNAVGTINPVGRIAALARNVGARLWVDAVHYAPHGPIDVQALGCDFLVCSAYKFFGPHLGVLWGRLELLEELPAYKVRPASAEPPYKFETGTLNHEGLAGLTATIDYLAALGRDYGAQFAPELNRYQGRRLELKQAMHTIAAYERPLFTYLLTEIQKIPGITIYGITNPAEFNERCPTLAFTRSGFTPQQIATYLGEQGIFVWDGNYYALSVTQRLGVEDSGGMVRVGLVHYNTRQEVDRLLQALDDMKPSSGG
uniref:Cysteine desulfurase family protein n=1 Tax=uncultured Chloroflexota bacterium TaxID=166587 RepID=H5SPD7_9CHLR|nr:cysteine desulfurase family protein [uncultured Chloroflexota bacterium]